jgi:hypothetical protein
MMTAKAQRKNIGGHKNRFALPAKGFLLQFYRKIEAVLEI